MADCELSGVEAPVSANESCETFYELGLMHAAGRDGAAVKPDQSADQRQPERRPSVPPRR